MFFLKGVSKIDRVIFFLLALFFVNQASAKNSFDWEPQLKLAVLKYRLDKVIPEEFKACKNANTTKMWVEFMKGLSYVESSWNPRLDNKCDLGCDHPSRGLFQMTGGDVALGKNCFDTKNKLSTAPFNPEKNIDCAVRKMKELLTRKSDKKLNPDVIRVSGSLDKNGSRYWGALNKKNSSYKKVSNLVQDIVQNCGSLPFEPYLLVQGSETRARRAAQSTRARAAEFRNNGQR